MTLFVFVHGSAFSPGLVHGHEVVSYALTRHARVLLDRFVQKSERLSALHGGHRVLPDCHLAMEVEPNVNERSYEIATEVTQPDESVARLTGWDQHAMERQQPTGLRDAVQLLREKREVLENSASLRQLPMSRLLAE